MKDLKLVEKRKFGNITCDVYEKGDDYFVTRDQIGRALGYKCPRKSIAAIHNRHKERFDKFSAVVKLETTTGKEKEIFLYSAKGVYEICRWSNQPTANDFYDFIYELLENIRTKKIKLKLEKQTPEWQQLRLASKTSTKTLHDDIHDKFIPYAIENGSKTYSSNPTIAYTHFDKPINKALCINTNDREQLDTIKQDLLDIMNKSCSCIINMEIKKKTDYHDIVKVSKDKLTQIASILV